APNHDSTSLPAPNHDSTSLPAPNQVVSHDHVDEVTGGDGNHVEWKCEDERALGVR
ncbi:hypothetical protein A2U01_0066050, partial [Trifolium medium]|nr:hypothetical protein [Trifolium medium]